jgi:cell division protein FtsB
VTRARWAALVALLALAIFAVGGGEYSERNYLSLRRQVHAADVRAVVLKREVDSLRSFRDSLSADPAVQERVAREQWGMIRPGEMAFRIITDSGH